MADRRRNLRGDGDQAEQMTRWGRGALACFPIIALLLLAPPPATAAISLGPTIDLPSQAVDFSGATVAVLADGSFAIAGYPYDLGFSQYQVQFFSAGGDLLPPVLLEAPVGYTEPPGFVGVGSLGGSYFVVWQPYRFRMATPWPTGMRLPSSTAKRGRHSGRHSNGLPQLSRTSPSSIVSAAHRVGGSCPSPTTFSVTISSTAQSTGSRCGLQSPMKCSTGRRSRSHRRW